MDRAPEITSCTRTLRARPRPPPAHFAREAGCRGRRSRSVRPLGNVHPRLRLSLLSPFLTTVGLNFALGSRLRKPTVVIHASHNFEMQLGFLGLGPFPVLNLSSVKAHCATSISPPLNMCIFFSLFPLAPPYNRSRSLTQTLMTDSLPQKGSNAIKRSNPRAKPDFGDKS